MTDTRILLGYQLEPVFLDEKWSLDAADQLLAYDPRAVQLVRVEFEPEDRIVITYHTDLGFPEQPIIGRASRRPERTFVIPKWVAPEKRTPTLAETCAARLIDQNDEPDFMGGNYSERMNYWRDKAIYVARRLRGEEA